MVDVKAVTHDRVVFRSAEHLLDLGLICKKHEIEVVPRERSDRFAGVSAFLNRGMDGEELLVLSEHDILARYVASKPAKGKK